jgi:predicted F0F1-ATPase subunit
MRKKDNRNVFKNLALITQIGLSMVIPIIIGVYLGGFIDDKVGTKMVFRLIFLLLGVTTAFVNLFKLTK